MTYLLQNILIDVKIYTNSIHYDHLIYLADPPPVPRTKNSSRTCCS